MRVRFLYFMVLAIFAVPGARAQMDEYSIKAGYLYNFSVYVEWPQNGPAAPRFVICIVGNDPFSGKLNRTVTGRKAADGRILEVKYLKSLDAGNIGYCQIAFISKSEKAHAAEFIDLARGMPIFTVGDFDLFAASGGVADLRIDGTKVKVDLNMKAAAKASLRVSARLQQVATLVSGPN